MATGATLPLANRTSVVPAEEQREAEFLAKLLHIRDEVFVGKHPRIRLPPKVLEQVAPRPPQTAPAARPTTNGTPNGVSNQQLFPHRSENTLPRFPSPNEFATSSRPSLAKSASSGIDPVLLTKSDHLIRAETQLKRQQLERTLKDQWDKRGRANDEEREVLDVDDLLAQAHRLVPPISGLRPPAAESDAGESFDNSYYSSKADSWSSDEADRVPITNADATGSLTQQGKRATNSAQQVVKASQPGPANAPVIDLDDEPYEPDDDILEIYEPEAAGVHEDLDESDYSPPPADAGPSEPRRTNGRYNNGAVNGSSRRQSPTGPVPPIQNGRKRKREWKKNNTTKRAAPSPEPYIKEEPQSPPPFAQYSDPPSSKRRALQPPPNGLEVAERAQPIYYRDQELARSARTYDEPLSPSIARPSQRRLDRDDQDLRRVASVQYARRPYSPTNNDMYAAPSSRQVRAASYVFTERPLEPPVYREASVRPSAAPRYVPEHPQVDYLERAQSPVTSPMTMAPPPRRIVVDQYGNKYYAAPVDARESVAPPSRRVEADPYYERAMTREPTLRAPARAELYEEDGVQMMPPPPRRYMAASEADVVDSRAYRREVSRRPVESERGPYEVIERRPIAQYEEMGPPREYLPSRAYSVRPEIIRREVPEGYARHESLQPGHVRAAAPRLREVSVIHHEPSDDRRYAFATPQRRYVDEGGLDRPAEVVQERYATEAPRRPTYRY
ncbi:hypothetical protein BU23DRAFT_558792 [Bimuria novae-zelandiae CBS 107.79]|uniref:Uncharacterized protein n=1 Tax=Bimuria novae-zelandiae CBS 107.79 TaxID=1447943 RepID=A0A6A5UVU2_9PLEO|nr:hypothetical protein BU23DRAFT_558792 [Bimuria novae-zelandiae CBS 107.79]